jgi:hypothetical protein
MRRVRQAAYLIGALGLVAILYLVATSPHGSDSDPLARVVAIVGVALAGMQFWQHRQQERRSLRAYLVVDEAKVFGPKPSEAKCRLTIRNGGQTPARRITVHSSFFVRFKGSEDGWPPSTTPFQWGVLAKDATFQCETPQLTDMVSEEFFGLQYGEADYFVDGRIVYFDAFGRQRTTRFRLSVSVAEMKRDITRMTASGDGNDYD